MYSGPPDPDDIDSAGDVHRLMSSRPDITSIDNPTGDAIWIHFCVGSYGDQESYRLELNFHQGDIWLHHETDDGTDTLWTTRRGR